MVLWKKPVQNTTTLMHCKARQVFCDLLSINQRNGSDMIFWQELLKPTPKILKTSRHQLYSDERFENLTNSGRSFTWVYKLKALKSSSRILVTNWFTIFLMHFNACDQIVVWTAVLLSMQQFYITKVMILIFSIIAMCSYFYTVCLVYRVLKNTHFTAQKMKFSIKSLFSKCD